MKNPDKHIIEESIIRFLDNRMTESEKHEFLSLLENNEANMRLFREYSRIWDRAANLEIFAASDTTGDWDKVRARMEANDDIPVISGSSLRPGSLITRIAAIALVLIVTGILLSRSVFKEADIIYVASMENSRNIVLPDGSGVLLNKNSSLEYPERFSGKTRQVKLEGEAYFEIQKDPGKLFRVNAGGACVDVLGTRFNVDINRDDNTVNIGIVSGKVSFYPLGKENDKLILIKDEQAILRDGEVILSENNDCNYLSWKTGTLIFSNDKIENVIDDLSRHFDKPINYINTGRRKLTLTSIFENQDMDSILEELKLVLGINYSVYGDTISIYNNK